ncbi:MAG TPA: hypothetical protein VHT73_03155 [Thermodesulfobacteriota bacterium]|nr:hypothetical protein [Thermodesulfobacteriota bacterium]
MIDRDDIDNRLWDYYLSSIEYDESLERSTVMDVMKDEKLTDTEDVYSP